LDPTLPRAIRPDGSAARRRAAIAEEEFAMTVRSSVGIVVFVGTTAVTGLFVHAQAKPPARSASEPAKTSTAAVDPAVYAQLHFRYIGPEGNRVSAVAGVPGDSNVYYAGAASGGLFKTTDGGVHWAPIFDDQPVSSIGALAVAPSDPNVVWAGTGEPFIRSHISVGWGVFKSTDAGKTWTKSGLEATGRISRLVVHPRNPDVVLACALGHAYGPQPDRGVFRTEDGGRTWQKVLYVDENTGCSDLVMDPNNPRILFAGMWQIEIHTWGRRSGGPGSGLYRSADGGLTWKPVEGNGLPTKPYGKVGLAMSKADSERVYALIEVGDGVPVDGKETQTGRLWRSDDGGDHWVLATADRQVAGRTHYYNRMAAMPDNADEAYFLTASWAKTVDAGKTITDPPDAQVPGGDHHDIWIDPSNGDRLVVSHDGGVSISTNRGRSWLQVQLPIAQMYHVTVDNRVPYFVYGNRQDGPSSRGPSNSKVFAGDKVPTITRGMWGTVGGGESGWATPDPVDPNLVWSSASGYGSGGGIVTTYDVRTNVSRAVEVWPLATFGSPAADLKYRFVWTFPLTISPHDHQKVYVGSQYVHVTTDRGETWQVISPDLTLNDKSRQQVSGGLTPDNIGVEYAGVVFSIAESRVKPGLIWAGTNDGQVQVTEDGGKRWANVTANIGGLPPWGTVSSIEPSRFDAATAYLVVDLHQVNNRDPWVYKTSDLGRTWRRIVSGLPVTPLSYAHVIREDPVRKGLLYLGTEGGLYVSFTDGDAWQPLQNDLPRAPVYDLVVQEHFGDLVVATYGRGFWILDDVTPLRALGPETLAKEGDLLAPRPVYRFRAVEAPYAVGYDPVAGFNPPYGAPINYWLKAAQKDEVSVTVLDASGTVVRTFKGPAKAGLNRVWWDLQFDKTKEARLRVPPLYAAQVVVPADGLVAPGVGRFAILAPPGTYTVKIKLGDLELTQPIVVRKDPESGGSEEAIRTQVALAGDMVSDINGVVDMINGIERVRGQLAALRSRLAADQARKAVTEATDALDKKLVAFEENLFQVRVTGRGQDVLRWPLELAEQLLYLADQVSGSDMAPTGPQREVYQLLHDRAKALRAQYDELTTRDLAAFNERLADAGLSGITARD
jgi:photosystem II stability/assembly factor-like uncharacterized protein